MSSLPILRTLRFQTDFDMRFHHDDFGGFQIVLPLGGSSCECSQAWAVAPVWLLDAAGPFQAANVRQHSVWAEVRGRADHDGRHQAMSESLCCHRGQSAQQPVALVQRSPRLPALFARRDSSRRRW